jgi:hypothetical protein
MHAVESFSSEWLALREAADHAARAERLVDIAVGALQGGPAVTVVDLAAGTGSNLRYLSARLPFGQHWVLVDHDTALLAEAARVGALLNVTADVVCADLVQLDDALPARTDGPLLVTASALLDLTSPQWLDRLASRCRAVHAVALFALTYDGRITCAPVDPMDELIRALVNRHQQRDKGFGPAAGPDATGVAAQAFERYGFIVHRAPSDWELGAESRALQQQLVDGWAAAAIEASRRDADAIQAWRARRVEAIERGTSRIDVGHEDLVCI